MVVDTKYYDLLNVSPQATTEEIAKSYKRLALKYHPDKTNDVSLTETFKEMTQAYEVLRDTKQRKVYDKYGIPGLDGSYEEPNQQQVYQQPNFGFPPFPNHMFNMFDDLHNMMNMNMNMNMGMNMNMDMKTKTTPVSQELQIGQDIHHTCSVSLSDLYHGKSIKLNLPKNCKCGICHGYGGTNPTTCRVCQGQGKTIVTQYNQFSKVQQVGSCKNCHGQGVFVDARCDNCHGVGYYRQKELLQISVPPGSHDKNIIILKNRADEGKNLIPGNVIIHLRQLPHESLVRKYHDLYMEYDLDLKFAILGGDIVIPHLGKDVKIHIDNTIVGTINSGEPKLIEKLGMPINNSIVDNIIPQNDDGVDKPKNFGNLFINFNVRIPSLDQFSPDHLQILSHILPSRPQPPNTDDIIVSHLKNIPNNGYNKSKSTSTDSSASPQVIDLDSDSSDQYSYNDIEFTDTIGDHTWNETKKRKTG